MNRTSNIRIVFAALSGLAVSVVLLSLFVLVNLERNLSGGGPTDPEWMWIIPLMAGFMTSGVTLALLSGRESPSERRVGANRCSCPACGGSIFGDWRLCPHCGARLVDEDTTTA